MYAMIATWCMAFEGMDQIDVQLKEGLLASEAVVKAISSVEDCPYFKSVGYGGLPNRLKEVELDAAYMDGSSLDFGAVCAAKTIKNPIQVARSLSPLPANNFRAGAGADAYAREMGFATGNLLTDRAATYYANRLKENHSHQASVYRGHDTVGMIALDQAGHLVAGTSTSGLFMKEPGRVGDSPVIGSGLYADSHIGGAVATGWGEDLMRGVISYTIVREMANGLSPQAACEKAVFELEDRLLQRRGKANDLSVVALNKAGDFGAASTIHQFSFVVTRPNLSPTVYLTRRQGDHMVHQIADTAWQKAYFEERCRPLHRL